MSRRRPRADADAVPAGLVLSLALLVPIDTHSAAVGDVVSAKVVKAVRGPDAKAIAVPEGAIAHGRIVQMQHRFGPPVYLISVRFDTIEIDGRILPLAARSERETKAEKARREGSSSPETGETASWIVPAPDGEYVIPAGFESKWTTVAAQSGVAQ